MTINDLPHRVPSNLSSRFLTAKIPLPKSSAGEAWNRSRGGGTRDGGPEAAVSLAAIQAHDDARAPPVGLIVQPP
jgi:hypothetical protein